MTVSAYAAALAEKIAAELPDDATATADPRAATPPCVLIQHIAATRAMCGLTVEWEVVALAPGPFNLDAWEALDALAPAVLAATDAEGYRVVAYRLALDNPPLPAYLFTFTGG